MEAPVKLISKFKPLYEDDSRYFVLTGGRGSSKSFHVTDFLLKLTYEAKHTILFSRYTMMSANVSVIPEFIDKIDRYSVNSAFTVNQNEIINRLTDSNILFKGIKTSSGNQTAALKSLANVTTFVLEEAEELVDESTFDKIDESIRVKGVQNRVILILNPTIKEHWIYKRFYEQADVEEGFNGKKGDTTYIHTTYLDNAINLNESIIKKFERLKETNFKQYKHRILGGWLDSAEGLVYENWRFIDKIPEGARLLGYGMDFGFSQDPAALVAVYQYDGSIIAHELIYQTHLTNSDLIKLMASKGVNQNSTIWADSAEPKTIQEISRAGYNVKPVSKGTDSIRTGIRLLQDFDKWYVTRSSHNIAKELRYYCWDTNKDGKVLDKPVDMYNHALDATRYWAMMELKSQSDYWVV